MKTGFYAEREKYNYDGFDFLEAESVIDENDSYICINYSETDEKYLHELNPYDYLHGRCDTFAEFLYKRYDYPAYMIKNPDTDKLVHCFNMVCFNNTNYYIDIRGITTDYEEFMSEFEDFVPDIYFLEEYGWIKSYEPENDMQQCDKDFFINLLACYGEDIYKKDYLIESLEKDEEIEYE